METDNNLNKTLNLIHSFLKGKHWYEDWYSMPYSDSNDDVVDFKIQYRIEKVSLWKSKEDFDCLYEGTVYIEPISLSLGVNDEWEHGFKQHDIYERNWDDLGDKLVEDILTYLPHVCVDYSFNFSTLNKK